jgi:hypothetical protein
MNLIVGGVARILAALLFGLLVLYIFSALTGYIPWLPEFGHVSLGLAGWIGTLLFLPVAYGLSFFTPEHPPPYFGLGLLISILSVVLTWWALWALWKRPSQSK